MQKNILVERIKTTTTDGMAQLHVNLTMEREVYRCTSYCIEHRIKLDDTHGIDGSHLWHNILCVTVSQVTLELHSVNNNQIAYVNRNKCSGHTPFADGL